MTNTILHIIAGALLGFQFPEALETVFRNGRRFPGQDNLHYALAFAIIGYLLSQ